MVHIVQGRLDEAEDRVREALRTGRTELSYYFTATGIAYLGEIEGHRGRTREAARLLGAAEAIREMVGARPFPLDGRRVEALLPEIREHLGPDAFRDAWAEGRRLRPEDLIRELVDARGAGPAAGLRDPSTAGSTGTPHQAADGHAQAATGEESRPPAAPERGDADTTSGGAGREAPSGPSVPPLVVEALGGFGVRVDGTPVEDGRWPYAKPRELLVYLLLHPGGRTRDQIGDALWPDATGSRVKNSFHVTLHHLRKALGHPEWIGIEGERYRIDPSVARRFDADTFEARARAALETDEPGDLREALGLYRGDLLEGDVVGRWIEEHREHLRRRSVELALALGRRLEEADPGAAAVHYRDLAGREELDEEVHRRLMLSLARAGDRVGAIRHFERLTTLLDRTLDAEPESETREVVERIRAGRV